MVPPDEQERRGRHDFTVDVKRRLAEKVGQRCSKPDCDVDTTGATQDGAGIVRVGVAAHITAAAPCGPRYDPNLAEVDRRSEANAIWLCQNHAKLIDSDASAFSPDLLRAWKDEAEARQRRRVIEGRPVAQRPDLRVKVSACREHSTRRRVAILATVENHSRTPAFIGWFHLVQSDGTNVMPERDYLTRQWNMEFRLEPGDSRTFGFPPQLFEGTEIVTAAVTDKIKRVYEAEHEQMREAIGDLHAMLAKDARPEQRREEK